MIQEKAFNLTKIALQAGAAEFYPETQTVKEQNYIVGKMFLERFARLVELETLEMAAKVCDCESSYWSHKHSEHGGYWAEDKRIGSEGCADEIRNPKETP